MAQTSYIERRGQIEADGVAFVEADALRERPARVGESLRTAAFRDVFVLTFFVKTVFVEFRFT